MPLSHPASPWLVRRAAVLLISLVSVSVLPWAASAATPTPGRISVPASIDGTGSTDVAAALARFIASVPDGSVVVFPERATYRLGTGLLLADRADLTFEGSGATLRVTATSGEPRTSAFMIERSTGITIRDLVLTGANPDAGTRDSHHLDRQDQGGVNVYGGRDILIEDTIIRETWGDCLYVGASDQDWAVGVTFRDSVCERTGRMGVALVAARDVVVERVRFDAVSIHVFDIEPDHDWQGAERVRFQDNRIGTYGLSPLLVPYFFAAEGAKGSVVRDVSVTGNIVTGGTLASTARRPNRSTFTFTDNVSTVPGQGPILRFAMVEALTVFGNDQPLASGDLLEGGITQPLVSPRVAAALVVSVVGLLAVVVLALLRGRRAGSMDGAGPAGQ